MSKQIDHSASSRLQCVDKVALAQSLAQRTGQAALRCDDVHTSHRVRSEGCIDMRQHHICGAWEDVVRHTIASGDRRHAACMQYFVHCRCCRSVTGWMTEPFDLAGKLEQGCRLSFLHEAIQLSMAKHCFEHDRCNIHWAIDRCLCFSAIEEATLCMADGFFGKNRGVRKNRTGQHLDRPKCGCYVPCTPLSQVDAMADDIRKSELQGFHRR